MPSYFLIIKIISYKVFCLFQAKTDTAKKRANMLCEMHFRNLRQKVLLLSKTEEAARQLEVIRLKK